MDEEVMHLFEAAKKAAEAAISAPAGGAAEARCLDALKLLKSFPVTISLLRRTQVGKSVMQLTRHRNKSIKAFVFDVIEAWKRLVTEEKRKVKRSNESPIAKAPMVENDHKTSFLKTSKKVSTAESESIKKIDHNTTPNSRRALSLRIIIPLKKAEKTNSSSVAPVNHTLMVKCKDPRRTRMRELLHEALSKAYTEASEDIKDQVNACDAVKVATVVEDAVYNKWGSTSGANRAKYRSLLFNIKDSKNPDFRRKVLLGHIKPEKIPEMPGIEMASDRRQRENQQIKDNLPDNRWKFR